MYYIADGYSLISRKLLIFRQCGLIEDINNKIAHITREICDRILEDNFVRKDIKFDGDSKKYGFELEFDTTTINSLYEIRLTRPSIPTLIADELSGIIDAHFYCENTRDTIEVYYGFSVHFMALELKRDKLYTILDYETCGDDYPLYFTTVANYVYMIGIIVEFQDYSFEGLDILFEGVKAEDYKDLIIDAKMRLLSIIEEHKLPIKIIGLPILSLIFS
jgi:hypothetical protein